MADEPNSIDEILERVHRLEDWTNVPDNTDTQTDTHEDEVQPPQLVEALTGAWAAAVTDSRRAKTDDERQRHLDLAKRIAERRDVLVADEFYVSVEDTEDSDLDLIRDTDPELHNKITTQRQKVRDEQTAAAEQRRRDDEFSAQSAEEQAKLRAAAEQEGHEQELENVLQGLVNETASAFKDPGDFAPRSDGRIMIHGAPELLEPQPPDGFKTGAKRAAEARTGLFSIKDLADQVVKLPPASRPAWWAARSEVERLALARAFGVRPPVRSSELDLEGTQP